MPLAEITVREIYPVYYISTKDDHWSEPEFHHNIDWLDIPQELIDEHKKATEIWRNSQKSIYDFLEEQNAR